MKIVSMERTEAEKKAAEKRYEAMPSDGPDYPWGLCLNLGKDEMDKLGIKGLPEVGEEFHIFGVAKVTRVSQSASEGGEDSKGIELQVTDLGLSDPDEAEDSAAEKLYGNKD